MTFYTLILVTILIRLFGKKMKIFEFEAELMKTPDMNATYIEFPYSVEKEFGTRGRVKVVVEINGYSYRTSLSNMGGSCHLFPVSQKHRKGIGAEAGDRLKVIIRRDPEKRIVETPADIEESLKVFPEIDEFFRSLSFTLKKEYVEWVEGAKKLETRLRRIEKGILTLRRMYDEKQAKLKKKKKN